MKKKKNRNKTEKSNLFIIALLACLFIGLLGLRVEIGLTPEEFLNRPARCEIVNCEKVVFGVFGSKILTESFILKLTRLVVTYKDYLLFVVMVSFLFSLKFIKREQNFPDPALITAIFILSLFFINQLDSIQKSNLYGAYLVKNTFYDSVPDKEKEYKFVTLLRLKEKALDKLLITEVNDSYKKIKRELNLQYISEWEVVAYSRGKILNEDGFGGRQDTIEKIPGKPEKWKNYISQLRNDGRLTARNEENKKVHEYLGGQHYRDILYYAQIDINHFLNKIKTVKLLNPKVKYGLIRIVLVISYLIYLIMLYNKSLCNASLSVKKWTFDKLTKAGKSDDKKDEDGEEREYYIKRD